MGLYGGFVKIDSKLIYGWKLDFGEKCKFRNFARLCRLVDDGFFQHRAVVSLGEDSVFIWQVQFTGRFCIGAIRTFFQIAFSAVFVKIGLRGGFGGAFFKSQFSAAVGKNRLMRRYRAQN